MLVQLAQQAQAQKEKFKKRAYERAFQTLQSHTQPIEDIETIQKLPGFGKSIMAKVRELVNTGKVEALEKLKDKDNTLLRIHGIGPVKAKELKAKGVTMENIHEHLDLLNDAQKKGVQYFHDLKKRIPRAEMNKHNALLLREKGSESLVEVSGSYRRGAMSSGDIDVLMTSPKNSDIKGYIDRLKSRGYIVDKLAQGPKKFMGICRLGEWSPFRHIDILWTEPHVYPFALLHFTGPQSFNIRMRTRAKEKGYKLSEYGISPPQPNDILFREEKDIFDFLDMAYIPPHERR